MAAIEYRASSTGSPPVGAWIATTRLTDGLPGDATTNASGAADDAFLNFGPTPLTAYVEGRHTLDSLMSLTAAQFTVGTSTEGSPSPASAGYNLYAAAADEVYSLIQTGSLPVNGSTTITYPGATNNVMFIKVQVNEGRTGGGAPRVALNLTDFRVTTSGTPTVPVALAASLSVDIALTGTLISTFPPPPPPPPPFWTEDCAPDGGTMTENCEAATVTMSISNPPARPTFTKAP